MEPITEIGKGLRPGGHGAALELGQLHLVRVMPRPYVYSFSRAYGFLGAAQAAAVSGGCSARGWRWGRSCVCVLGVRATRCVVAGHCRLRLPSARQWTRHRARVLNGGAEDVAHCASCWLLLRVNPKVPKEFFGSATVRKKSLQCGLPSVATAWPHEMFGPADSF